MLGKLIKYEFKSLVHDLGVLYAVWLTLSILVSTLPKVLTRTPDFMVKLLNGAWLISLIAALVMTLVVIIDRRFYKNFYGIEGYFTLSLPIKASTHIWSKVITTTVWMVLTCFVGMISMMIVSAAEDGFKGFQNIAVTINENPAQSREVIILLLELLILGIIYISRFVVKLLTCINISVQFSRFKTLIQGVLFVAITALEIYVMIYVIGKLSGKFVLNFVIFEDKLRIAVYGLGVLILIQAAEFAIYFLVSNYLMKNRLNLE
nr:hypothetical protein [uncultured Mogibacterium sp.]